MQHLHVDLVGPPVPVGHRPVSSGFRRRDYGVLALAVRHLGSAPLPAVPETRLAGREGRSAPYGCEAISPPGLCGMACPSSHRASASLGRLAVGAGPPLSSAVWSRSSSRTS